MECTRKNLQLLTIVVTCLALLMVFTIPFAARAMTVTDLNETSVEDGKDFQKIVLTQKDGNLQTDIYFYNPFQLTEFSYYFNTGGDRIADILVRCGRNAFQVVKETEPGWYNTEVYRGTPTISGNRYSLVFPWKMVFGNVKQISLWLFAMDGRDRFPDEHRAEDRIQFQFEYPTVARMVPITRNPLLLPQISVKEGLFSSAQTHVVDGAGHIAGPLPVIFYALTEPTGRDVYPLGDGGFSLFGLYDSGSTKVRINASPPPNRVAGPNWNNSDTGHLRLSGIQTVNLRLNGLNARLSDGNIPIGPSGSNFEPQVEVRNIAVKPERVDVTLIGAPVINQLVAHIDYTRTISDPSGVKGPYIDLYWPNDSRIPRPALMLQLEKFGNPVSTDGATAGHRYLLRNMTFKQGNNAVSDREQAFKFLFDTGTTITIVNNRIANVLGLAAMSASFNCYGGRNNGYTIDSVMMSGTQGTYQIHHAAICWQDSATRNHDAVIGSNFFDQVELIIDGPQQLLGIKFD